MARLMPPLTPIPASQQFAAIAHLRWRLFANSFRRKGGAGELAARIFSYPIFAVITLGPVAGTAFAANAAIQSNQPNLLAGIFWAVFVLQILVSINISPPELSFDPQALIRFPLTFPRFLAIRLVLGLLSVSTVAGALCLIAAAIAITLASPMLAPVAFVAALLLALANLLFIRMVFAWIDRWLSTRRARELFTALIILGSLGFQYINATVSGFGGSHLTHAERAARIAIFLRVYHRIEPILTVLPPGLAGNAIAHAQRPVVAVLCLLGILVYAALFLAIFAARMHREYRGEDLSEASSTSIPPSVQVAPVVRPVGAPGRHQALIACLQKDWIYLRRNTAQLYGLLAPLAMVFIFAGRNGALAHTGYPFPAALTYAVLGLAALAYNTLGSDAAGVQLYLLAPVPMRTVLFAKNLFSFAVTVLQVVLVYLVTSLKSGPPPRSLVLETILWLIVVVLVNTTIGNRRSVTAPRKIDAGKVNRGQAGQLSALIAVLLIFTLAGLGAGLHFLALYIDRPWLPIPILLAFIAVALTAYLAGLNGVDALVKSHRETLLEALAKV